MENELFQKVFDIIQSTLPESWTKMVLYVGYTTGSFSMKYYVSDGNLGYTDCFSLKSVGKATIIKQFMNLDKILSSERNRMEEKDKWSVLTLIVDKNGNMKADFDYSDISESSIEYERKWKEKYLS